MKKITSLLAAFSLLFCLAACSNTPADPFPSSPGEISSSNNNQTAPDDSLNPSPSPEENADSEEHSNPAEEPTKTDGKSLVIYFSHSGNTESVAKEIQSQTGADIFEIVPATPYTTDYNTLLDVAQKEKRDNARPGISGRIENIGQYDVIYLGYPNWWADMPMVLYTFLDAYDLSGKTVAPFVTSGGSGFSNTISVIRSLEPNATVTEGLAIRDSASSNPEKAVSAWLERLK